jgi:hypothetical protein
VLLDPWPLPADVGVVVPDPEAAVAALGDLVAGR